jgi:hypothetical protein
VNAVQTQLRVLGQAPQAERLEAVLSHLSDAQRATTMFDPDRAQAAADLALQARVSAGGGS